MDTKPNISPTMSKEWPFTTVERVMSFLRSSEMCYDPMYQKSMDTMWHAWQQPKYEEARRSYEQKTPFCSDQMYSFDDYTVQIYQTPEEYYSEVPDHRFVACLREVPEASLHAYGPTHEKATRSLRKLFEGLKVEIESKFQHLPPPKKKEKP